MYISWSPRNKHQDTSQECNLYDKEFLCWRHLFYSKFFTRRCQYYSYGKSNEASTKNDENSILLKEIVVFLSICCQFMDVCPLRHNSYWVSTNFCLKTLNLHMQIQILSPSFSFDRVALQWKQTREQLLLDRRRRKPGRSPQQMGILGCIPFPRGVSTKFEPYYSLNHYCY